MSVALWDRAGYGECYTGDGCYVLRYEDGNRVEAWGPYDSERKCENARLRIRRGQANATDNRLRNTPRGLKLLAKRPDGGGA